MEVRVQEAVQASGCGSGVRAVSQLAVPPIAAGMHRGPAACQQQLPPGLQDPAQALGMLRRPHDPASITPAATGKADALIRLRPLASCTTQPWCCR